MRFFDWWETFFCPRYRFRNFGLLDAVTPDLRRNQKCYGGDFINVPPKTCDRLNDIPILNVDSDGRYLLMQSTNDCYTQIVRLKLVFGLLFFVFGILFVFDNFILQINDPNDLITIKYLFIGFVSLAILRVLVPAKSVLIFDRANGNVYFPSKLFHRAIVVPYKEVVAMKFYHVYNTGMFRTYLYLCPSRRPKGEFRRFDRIYISGRDIPGHDAPLENLWCNVLRFMDKSKPLPHFESLSSHIQWYKDNGTTIPQRYANYAKLRMPYA